jgi:hypothetical protein
MLQPKYLLMKRGTLLGRDPQEGRKVFAAIGFPDFAAGISVVFAKYCPAAVSDSETVFLCPFRSLAAPQSRRIPSAQCGAGALKTASLIRLFF